MKRKSLVFALVAVMMLAMLAACTPSTTSSSSSSSSSQGSSSVTSGSEEAVAGINGFTAFESNVTLRIPVYDRGVEGVPNVSSNYWTEWLQENFGDTYNVTMEFVPITRTDVLTDYALLAAGKKLPTVLMEYDYPKVAQWANDGYLTTYDLEEFAFIAPTYYEKMVANNQLVYTQMNDETYFALAERPNSNTPYSFQTFVRMDWLEAVGYDYVPVVWSDIDDAMSKIIEAGLAKNPLGGHAVTGVGSDQNYAFRTLPQVESEWAMYGNVDIPSLSSEANYKFLKRENYKYNAGYTNPEYYITEVEANKAAFINGEVYEYIDYISANMETLNAFYAQNPDAKLAIKPLETEVDSAEGTTPLYRSDNPFGMIVCFSSSATADELKAAWMYMEWMLQEENLFNMQWGVEGENYNYDATTGLPVSVGDYSGDFKQGFNNNKDYWCIVIESRNAGTVEDSIAAMAPAGLPQDLTQEIIDMYYQRVQNFENGYATFDPIFSVALPAEAESAASLTELYKEYRDRLTMCTTEEFDALYEELSQKFLDAGYQDILDQRLEAYNNGNTTKLS